MSERRKHERFTVYKNVYIYSSSMPEAFLGKIIDISQAGIAFSYVMDFPAPDDMSELGILVPKVSSVFGRLPFKTISDENIQNHLYSHVIMRRRSGQFIYLTPEQERGLNLFINNLDKKAH